MPIKDAYDKLGADYDDVLRRLMNDSLVSRFATKFLEEESFEKLRGALAAGDAKEAFMAAHSLKGVVQNLGFSNMFDSVIEITETLRAGSLEGTQAMFEKVETEYKRTVEALREFL